MNRLLRVDYPGTEADTAYRYDTTRDHKSGQTGRLTESRRGDIVTRLYHDLRGNQTANSVRNAATNHIISDTHYAYDADDRLTKIQPTAARHVQYHYDIAGQVQRIDLIDANGTTVLADTIRHLPFGPIQLLRYGNGLELHRSYDQNYHLTLETVGTFHDLNYDYQADGSLTQITDSIDGSRQSFSYDSLHQLTTAITSQKNGQNQEYIYDLVGNRAELHRDKTITLYNYAPDSQRLTGVSRDHRKPTSYISNPQGNVNRIGTLTLNYSADQRLSTIAQAKNKKHGREQTHYRYDAQGQRIAKTTAKGTTYYAYNLDQQLIGEDAGGPSHYAYLEGQPLARIDGVGNGAKLYYFHNNQIGAPLKVSNQAGQVVWNAELDPFGKASTINPDIVQNLRFPGQYYDQETGWHYNMQRYYDPGLGRYLQSDPIGLMGIVNSYAYVENYPLNMIDPLGLTELAPGQNPLIGGGITGMGSGGSSLGGSGLSGGSAKLCFPVIKAPLALPSLQVPNAGGRIISDVTTAAHTFFRVFSGNARIGGYLTAVPPRSSAFAQEALALPSTNSAAFIQEVLVPAGTRLQRSRAVSIRQADDLFPLRRGGAEQFQLLDRIPLENFRPGVPLR